MKLWYHFLNIGYIKITFLFLHTTSWPRRYQRVLHAGRLSEWRLSEHAGQLQMFLQGWLGVGEESMCWWVIRFLSSYQLQLYYILFHNWIPKWNPVVSFVRVSRWAGSVLPDSVWGQGLRAPADDPPQPALVLLHGGQSLGPQLWKMSSGGHRWVNGDLEEQLQAEKVSD